MLETGIWGPGIEGPWMSKYSLVHGLQHSGCLVIGDECLMNSSRLAMTQVPLPSLTTSPTSSDLRPEMAAEKLVEALPGYCSGRSQFGEVNRPVGQAS